MGPIRNSSILFRFGHEDKVSSNPRLAMLTLSGCRDQSPSNRACEGRDGSYTHCRRAILLMATTSNPKAWTFVDPNVIGRTSSIERADDVLGPDVL